MWVCVHRHWAFSFLVSYSKNLKSAHRWKGNSFISRDSAGDSSGDATRKQQARRTRDQGCWLLFTAPFHGVQNEDVLISMCYSWVVLFWLIVLGLGLHKFFFIACGFFCLNLIKLIQIIDIRRQRIFPKCSLYSTWTPICSSCFCPLPLVPTCISGHVWTERFGVCVAPGRTEFQDAKCIGKKKVCVCSQSQEES